ncbi:hypothetical protein ABIA32_000017 [Streptacidiphilus sp. MAP12-20]|uniref:LamG domain-containing protein n=1 Tax=Streptacidiphilus sp. MAP12-20 TaxID=3156299 RepID=UPI0035154FE0
MTDHMNEDMRGTARGTRGIARVLRRALAPVAAAAALALAPVSAVAAPHTGSPTVPGHPSLLADANGRLPLAVTGPSGSIKHIPGGWVLATHGDGRTYAQSAAPAVNVGGAFTVSAWVYADGRGGSESAVSQGAGTANASFSLGRAFNPGHFARTPLWDFSVSTAPGTVVSVFAPASYHVDKTWALLTGVWDPSRHRISLYVDGKLAGIQTAARVVVGHGGLQLGREADIAGWTDAWNGVIGHVQVWNRALTPAQVLEIDKHGGPKGVPAAHSWLVA